MNPYAQPFGAPAPAPQQHASNLNLAAILLMVTGGLAIAYGLMSIVMALVGSDGSWALNLVQDPALRDKMREAMAQQQGGASKAANMIWPLIIIGANAVVIFGALKMKGMQGYGLAMASAIISTIPCCFNGCCCVTSMPAGIFALVLLLKPEVKASFTS